MGQYFIVGLGDDERWALDVASEEAPLNIWACRRVSVPSPIPLVKFEAGKRVEYDVARFAIPIVSRRVGEYLESVAPDALQRIPAVLPGDPGEWEVLNVLSRLDCIDHKQSTIVYYPPDHPEHPGKPRGVIWLVLDQSNLNGRQIFRPTGWEVKWIVSRKVKEGLEAMGVTGMEFFPIPTVPLVLEEGAEPK